MGTHTYAYVYLFVLQPRWWVLQFCCIVSICGKSFLCKQISKALGYAVSWGSKFEGSFLGKVIFTSYMCVCKCMFVCRLIICPFPLFGGPRPLPLLPLASSLMYKLQISITLIILFFCADVNFFSPRPNFFPRSKIFF